jgi:sugar lactone lactonase YvrE
MSLYIVQLIYTSRIYRVTFANLSYFQGPTGRLLTYDPATGATHVLATGLWFANGVALAADESFVVVGSTFSARLYRHWLQGPKVRSSNRISRLRLDYVLCYLV